LTVTIRAICLGVALLTLGVMPATAQAAETFYARGGGGNTKAPCTEGEPCNLQKAVNEAQVAGVGSSVVLMPGPEFTPTSAVFLEGIDVGGEPGAARPTVVAPAGDEAFALRTDATLHDVDVVGGGASAVIAVGGGTVERAFVESTTAGDSACVLFDAVVNDSVCLAREALGVLMSGSTATYHSYLHNVDAIGAIIGIDIFAPLSPGLENRLEATNTIAIGGSEFHDVAVSGDSGGAQALFVNSDYATTEITGGSENLRITPAGTNGNIVTPPQFVDEAVADFRQLATSPTIDAGLTASANGALDLDRNPRDLTAHPTCDSRVGPPDIGAYEYVAPAPTCAPEQTQDAGKSAPPPPPPPPAPGVPGTTLKKAKIDRSKGTTTFTFLGTGEVSGFVCELVRPAPKGAKGGEKAKRAKPKFASCKSPQTYKPLAPGHYTFEVEATGAAGADPTPAKRKFSIVGGAP
jgi:hypothetical protein